MIKTILELNLVPASSWFNNVRSMVSRSQWDMIRKQVYSEAYHLCQICGGVGPNHPVEAHEQWNFDDINNIQKLQNMIALCHACHQVKHFGFAQVSGKEDVALKHLMKINKMNKRQAEKYIKECLEQWYQRSLKNWKLDLSHLSKYGIDINNIKYQSTT